jgi:prepilin-type N-terminal cleavage/methylation domain-containing protein
VRSSCHSGAGGFSLIEVLFALAIIAVALGTAATLLNNGLLAARTSSDVAAALALADEKLAEAGVSAPLQPGTSSGVFGRFSWVVTIVPFDDSESASQRLQLYRIDTRIGWRDGFQRRQLALATVRIGPPPP